MIRRTTVMLALMSLASFGLSAQAQQDHAHDHGAMPPPPDHAVAVLLPTSGSDVSGLLHLRAKDGKVHVTGKVINLTPGEHGFHIHEFGDLTDPTGTAAGGHYDPSGHEHGPLEDEHSHAGDLGNITAGEDGTANVDITTDKFKLHFVLGRAFVVHGDPDDLKSQPSGNAGPRVAVGVIGIAKSDSAE